MKKFIFLLLWSFISLGQVSNQMVSYTDAQSLNFTLNSGQSHVNSSQCMTKNDALTKYNLSSSAMSSYASNQLVPRSVWLSGITGTSFQLIETTGTTWASVCSTTWTAPVTKYTIAGLVVNGRIYNDIGCTSVFQIIQKTFKVLEGGVYKRVAGTIHSDVIELLENCPPPPSYYAYSFSASKTSSSQSCVLSVFGTTWYSSSVNLDLGSRLFVNSGLTTGVSGGGLWFNCQQTATSFKVDNSGYIIEYFNCP